MIPGCRCKGRVCKSILQGDIHQECIAPAGIQPENNLDYLIQLRSGA